MFSVFFILIQLLEYLCMLHFCQRNVWFESRSTELYHSVILVSINISFVKNCNDSNAGTL